MTKEKLENMGFNPAAIAAILEIINEYKAEKAGK